MSGMSADRFTLDTNILFYSLDPNDAVKQQRARQVLALVREGRGFLALQTLGELCNSTSRRRSDLAAGAHRFARFAEEVSTIVVAEPKDLPEALTAHQAHGLQFWDAMLWATARRNGCNVLLSEDFQDGRTLSGVTFRNPFTMSASELEAL